MNSSTCPIATISTPGTSCGLRRETSRFRELTAIGIFLACIATAAWHTADVKPSAEVGVYHQQVRSAIQGLPKESGKWVGIDVPVPTQAENLLRPTALLSRRYVNTASGESCIVTIVHCGNPRSMLDHYPPNCYPGVGWVLDGQSQVDLNAQNRSVAATEYHFKRGGFGTTNEVYVTNAMLLPTGITTRDMSGLEHNMGEPTVRALGVGQLQVYFDQAATLDRRRQMSLEMLEMHEPCLHAILRN